MLESDKNSIKEHNTKEIKFIPTHCFTNNPTLDK